MKSSPQSKPWISSDIPHSRRSTAHEDGPQYLQASHHLNDIDAKKEGFQDTYRPIDTSNKKSPNVYVDEQEGSDVAGVGTRQAPYHSIKRALRARPDATVYYKKRFLCHLNEFNPADIPASAIPVRVGGFVTTYWFLLPSDRKDQLLEQIDQQDRAQTLPSYGSVMGDKSSIKSSTSSLLSSLKKAWSR